MASESLPLPPADLARRKITITEFSDSLFRTHDIRHGPVFFGNTGFNRFDAPDGSYKVFYAGRDAFCAFIETFGGAPGTRIVTTAALKSRALTELRPRRAARLIDLTASAALVRIGADSNLFSGAYSASQAWSKALHGHPSKADGLLYPSRLDPTRHAIVLFSDRRLKLTELVGEVGTTQAHNGGS